MASGSIQYCCVKGCRFSDYHTTIAHRCGTCNQYGHGQIECNNTAAKSALLRHLEDQMPAGRQCGLSSCTYPWSHSSESHHCYRCGGREHDAGACPERGRVGNGETYQMRRLENHLSRSATKEPETIVNIIEENTINKCCPMCRQSSDIDLGLTVFTDSPCPVCFDTKPKIIFSGCKHANVCRDCAVLL